MPLHTSHVGLGGLSFIGVAQPILTATCENYDPTNPASIVPALFIGAMTLIDWITRHKKSK